VGRLSFFSSFVAVPVRTRWVLALACLVHFAMGALVGLSVDEAHYALYAAHPALSYFDHPPLVGWVQWPLVALHAPTAVLRLLPEALWLGTALLVFQLAQRLQALRGQEDAQGAAGHWAVAVLALAPLLHILGLGLLPDTLLMFLSAALMWLTLDLMQPDRLRAQAPWLALGVVLGLAGLSKYTAIVPALAVAVCVLRAHGVRVLVSAGPWLAVVVAVLLVLPVALWNAQNGWISFAYQAEHGAGGDWSGLHVARFVLLQVLVYGPLLCWGGAGVLRMGVVPARALGWFFVLPMAVFTLASGGGTSLPHWTAPAWTALAPFAGLALAHTVQHGRRGQRLGVVVVVWAQGLACVGLLGLMLSAGWPFVSGSQGQGNSQSPSNPLADVYGWDVAGQRAQALAAQHGLTSVAVQNWTLASRMGWYARPLPVHVLEDRFTQFSLWAGDLPVGGDTLLVDWSQLAYTVPQAPHGFAHCALVDTQDVQRLGATIATFRFYACRRWSGSPQPQLQGHP
jgi:4-amino-4-deoxy-L-arabinose transferase-like glycosyltransferase